MVQLLQTPQARVVILFAAMLMLIAVGAYIVGRFRGRVKEDQSPTSDMITKFREMHSRGDLSEKEYRTIKTELDAKFQEEINDNGEPG